MTFRRLALVAALVAVAFSQQGCVAAAVGTVAGTAIGVTGAVVGGAAKMGGKAVVATGKAVIPGDGKKDREDYRR